MKNWGTVQGLSEYSVKDVKVNAVLLKKYCILFIINKWKIEALSKVYLSTV